MKKYEYTITTHRMEDLQELVIFCTQSGECTVEDVPTHQINLLQTILNERGTLGWELVEVTFGKKGVMAFWKREAVD
ncbi:MAG: hypothetical protein M0P57_12625 [Syntrophales bacterium]|jgi:hypothetical protein|nr:hypothetical protein [Syntrophales bacterium]MDY0044487.1 hypothetical protein [Syntrophales bacterium]